MEKKVIAITGPTSGIGESTAKRLAESGHQLILLSRNEEKLKLQAQELKLLGANEVDHYMCDLADLQSVRRAASELKKKHQSLDVLVNNAGGIIPELRYSADNLEYTFAMNHLGHFYLTSLLKEELAKSNEPRVISVSSEAHRMGKLDFSDLS